MTKVLRILGKGWMWLSVALIGLSVISHIVMAPTIWEGFADVQEWFSPFNLLNWIAVAVLLSPCLGLIMLAEKIEKRRRVRCQEPLTFSR